MTNKTSKTNFVEDNDLPSAESRYFQKEGSSANQFWEITVSGSEVRLRSGKDSVFGAVKVKSHDSPAAAAKYADKQIQAKLKSDFREKEDEALWLRAEGKKVPLLMRVPLDVEELSLRFGYEKPALRIDLSPLPQLAKLRSVTISDEKLMELSLGALGQCPNLEDLYLHNTGLKVIDLSPLAECKKLKKLTYMKHASVDLTPLASCESLETLDLMGNTFKSLDLSPLAAAPKLTKIHLVYSSKLKSLDLAPLKDHPSLTLVTIDGDQAVTGEDKCSAEVRRRG